MKTLDDARRATELGDMRSRLIDPEERFLLANEVYFAASGEGVKEVQHLVKVEACGDEFRALVAKEINAQLAKIDTELRALGIEPAHQPPPPAPSLPASALWAQAAAGSKPSE